MGQCINTDPEDLLREHKHLLFTNFRKLANGPAQEKRQWVAEYHAAKSLARHVGKGTKVTLKTRYTQAKHAQSRTEREAGEIDSQGSQRWRRRRRI